MTTKLLFIVVAVDDTTQTENKHKKPKKNKIKAGKQLKSVENFHPQC